MTTPGQLNLSVPMALQYAIDVVLGLMFVAAGSVLKY